VKNDLIDFVRSLEPDDVWWKDCKNFEGKQVIVSEKQDGECLHEETLIETEQGNKKIKEMSSYKGKIRAYDLENDVEIMTPIGDFFVSDDTKEWFEIETENGITLKITGEHLVWLPLLQCYRKVKNLEINDVVLLKN
jgi:hypothetical protein